MHSKSEDCQTLLPGAVRSQTGSDQVNGKPGLMIEADHIDSQSYAPKQVEKQIQIFLDIINRRIK